MRDDVYNGSRTIRISRRQNLNNYVCKNVAFPTRNCGVRQLSADEGLNTHRWATPQQALHNQIGITIYEEALKRSQHTRGRAELAKGALGVRRTTDDCDTPSAQASVRLQHRWEANSFKLALEIGLIADRGGRRERHPQSLRQRCDLVAGVEDRKQLGVTQRALNERPQLLGGEVDRLRSSVQAVQLRDSVLVGRNQ